MNMNSGSCMSQRLLFTGGLLWVVPRIFRRLGVEKNSWPAAATLLMLPTLILDPFSCAFFSTVFPNVEPGAAGVFGGWMLIFCAGAVLGVWLTPGVRLAVSAGDKPCPEFQAGLCCVRARSSPLRQNRLAALRNESNYCGQAGCCLRKEDTKPRRSSRLRGRAAPRRELSTSTFTRNGRCLSN